MLPYKYWCKSLGANLSVLALHPIANHQKFIKTIVVLVQLNIVTLIEIMYQDMSQNP